MECGANLGIFPEKEVALEFFRNVWSFENKQIPDGILQGAVSCVKKYTKSQN
jgi:hypothetical protein